MHTGGQPESVAAHSESGWNDWNRTMQIAYPFQDYINWSSGWFQSHDFQNLPSPPYPWECLDSVMHGILYDDHGNDIRIGFQFDPADPDYDFDQIFFTEHNLTFTVGVNTTFHQPGFLVGQRPGAWGFGGWMRGSDFTIPIDWGFSYCPTTIQHNANELNPGYVSELNFTVFPSGSWNPSVDSPVISSQPTMTATVGQSYHYYPASDDTINIWSARSDASWLRMDQYGLYGTPSAAGIYRVSLVAINQNGTGWQNFSIIVSLDSSILTDNWYYIGMGVGVIFAAVGVIYRNLAAIAICAFILIISLLGYLFATAPVLDMISPSSWGWLR